MYFNGWTDQFIRPADYNQQLFYWSTIAYITSSVIFMPSLYLQRPGLDVQVMIQTAERTFLQYIMKPVTDSMQRAFREN